MKKALFFILVCTLSAFSQKSVAQCTPAYCDAFDACNIYGMYIYDFSLPGSIGTLTDAGNACNFTGYRNLTALPTCTLVKGSTYTASITTGDANDVYCEAWIDFNNDNVFQTSEVVGYTSSSFLNSTTFTITPPSGASVGIGSNLRLRVGLNWAGEGGVPPSMDPCEACSGNNAYGETRDYFVTVVNPPPAISATPTSLNFGNVVVGNTSAPLTTSVSGLYLTGAPVTIAAPPGFLLCFTSGGVYTPTLSPTYTAPTLNATTVYVEFQPTAYSIYTNSVTVTGGGAPVTTYVAVTGNGVASCSGSPAATTAAVSPAVGGTATAFTLSLSPAPTVGGLTYQWYNYSTLTGSFSIMGGATTSTYTFTGISTNTYYYCVVTCAGSGLSTTSSTTEATYTPVASACSGIPTPGTVVASATAGCSPSYTSNLSLLGSQVGPDITYTWLSSTTASTTGFTFITGAVSPFYTANVTGTIWIEGNVTCNTSGVSKATPAVKLTFNTPPAAITGVPIMCLGTPSLFSDATGGGTWSSSNTSIVGIAPSSGIATGVIPGAATIAYTLPTGCSSTQTVSVNAGLTAISGNSNVCVAFSTTLSDLVAGGLWSSSNAAMATVGSGTGVVTGVAAGAATITYQLPSGCYVTQPMTVNPPPAAMTGALQACVGSTSVLSDATPGGTWSTIDVFEAAVGSVSGIVTGVAPGTTNIRYILPTGCRSIMSFTVSPLPASIGGTMAVCDGSTTTLTDATLGGVWSSSNPSLATVDPVLGTVTGVNAGMPVITYTAPGTGCQVNTPVTVNTVPTPESVTVTDGGQFCPGGTGVHVGLSGSETGVEYDLWFDALIAPVDSMPGSVTSLDFGLTTDTGTYYITGYNIATGCVSYMMDTVHVFNVAPPATYTVGGGGSYCAGGTGVNITLDSSDAGVKYQLFFGGTMSGGVVTGTGGALTFGPETAWGLPYTVVAENVTTLCTSVMSGSAFVYISSNPPVYTLLPGGSYCVGGMGVDIMLSNSDGGILYKLYYNNDSIASVYGSGTALDFGNATDSGNYTVTASDFTDNCTDNMLGVATVHINPLPQPYLVNGGGSYCLGTGVGDYIGLDFSVIGTNYTLSNSFGAVETVSGSNSGLDFGLQTIAGVYTVVAEIASTTCTASMPGSATIIANTPPTPHNVTGTANYCFGTGGVPVGVDGSDLGVNFKYQLYLNGVPVDPTQVGTGGMLSFGNQSATGNYTVIALDTTTLCSTTMADSAVVGIDSLPYLYNVTGGGNFCTGGPGVNVVVNNSQAGITYNLLYDGSVSSSITSTGGVLTFGPETLSGVYTVVAQNAITTCSLTMSGSASVGLNPLPGRYSLSGGGGYCDHGTGVPVGITTSNTGISYQLYNNGVAMGSPLLGTGSALNFGITTDTGTYTIIATNTATFCTDTMPGSEQVVKHLLPTVYTVSGGGSFCAGTVGVPVGLSGSDLTGVTYYLYDGSTSMGSLPATGNPLNFGNQNVSGTYKVVAMSSPFVCTDTMASDAVLIANPLPTVYSISGGGSYCAGDTGVHLFLSGSNTYVNYQVFNGTATVGSFWAGTGLPLDLGLDTGAGTYSITAISVPEGCTSHMSDTTVITVVPTVAAGVMISTPAVDTVCSGSNVSFTATGVNGGTAPVYQWKVNGTLSGSGTTYNYMPANGDSVSVVITSNAVCASPASASSYTNFGVLPSELPAVAVTPTSINVCPGTMVTFSATPTYGGNAPIYSWKVGGVSYGTSASTYSYVPADSDVVFATLASSYLCSTRSLVLSNDVIITVNEPAVPNFSIATSPVTNLLYGQNATLTANVTNAAANVLSYEWKVNGVAISGATNASFTSSSLNDNDIVCCTIMSHNTCGSSAPATQCETMVIYGNTGVAQTGLAGSDIRVVPNPNNGTFSIKGTLGGTVTGDQELVLEVTNMLGQVVYTNKVMTANGVVNEQVTLAKGLANGMYLLNVHSGSDNAVFHFVVEQ